VKVLRPVPANEEPPRDENVRALPAKLLPERPKECHWPSAIAELREPEPRKPEAEVFIVRPPPPKECQLPSAMALRAPMRLPPPKRLELPKLRPFAPENDLPPNPEPRDP
jgi:hypothetical protein